MKQIIRKYCAALALCCLALTGCVDRAYKIIGQECPQVAKYEPPYAFIKKYIHSITLYEEYETKAHFDVLIMSDQMRALYAALKSEKQGLSKIAHQALLNQQLQEGAEVITIYVLAQIADQAHVSLADANSAWNMYLRTPCGEKIQHCAVKAIELSPEIRALFGHRALPFKKSYVYTFPAKDSNGALVARPGQTLSFIFTAAGIDAQALEWAVEPATRAEAEISALLKRRDNKSLWQLMKEVPGPKDRDEDYYF